MSELPAGSDPRSKSPRIEGVFSRKTLGKKAKPIVMAYIGDDDPNRGDSRGSTGLARVIAEMINGRFVYVDAAMLEKSFPNVQGIGHQFRAYVEKNGKPEIMIGTRSRGALGYVDFCPPPCYHRHQ